MAALFEKIKAAPNAWIILKTSNCSPVWDTQQSPEPIVNNANPRLYNLTRPNISASLPKVNNIEAVTTQYPIAIQTSVIREVCNSLAIDGRAIIIIFLSRDAMRVPIVVLLNANHL